MTKDFKYQIFELKPDGSGNFSIDNFLDKNFNLIEGFLIGFNKPTNLLPDSQLIIDEFFIDDLIILPKGFFIDNIFSGPSIPFQGRFTKLNIPTGNGKLKIRIRQAISTISNVSIIFKLKQTNDESIFFKDYYKYDVHSFRIDLLNNVNDDGIFKKTFRKIQHIEHVKGVYLDLFTPFVRANPNKKYQLGTLKMSINSGKSNPINVPIYSHTAQRINYKKSFIELDEKLEPSLFTDIVFERHPDVGIDTYVHSFVNTIAYFTLTIKGK